MSNNISLCFNTVRYMTFRQWKYRVYYSLRNRCVKRIPKKSIGKLSPLRIPLQYKNNVYNYKSIDIADRILEGIIPTINGKTVAFNGDWDLINEKYRMVSFKLNSFRWLLDLSDTYKITQDPKYINCGIDLIKNWNEHCGLYISGDKWNAYVIAERITHWIGFVSEYCDEVLLEQIAEWVFSQAMELKSSIEFQLGANHLLSEAKSLIIAGTFLKNDKLYEFGKRILLEECKEQFLPDGGHYERSVSYHIESLQQLFESYVVMRIKDDSDADTLISIMKDPYSFLNGMISVNNRIPLFNDSAYDYPFYDASDFLYSASLLYSPLPPKGNTGYYSKRWSLLEGGSFNATWESRKLYENTGFVHYSFEVEGKRYSFYMDCGNNGPDYNLGHAHADALSILLFSENKDILVDSGVFTYKPGVERNNCRSTKAHNTVEVDGENSAEVWSAFRVARRGYTSIDDYSLANGMRIVASHNGYSKVLNESVIHKREVVIQDSILEIKDFLISQKSHNSVSRFHISPDCQIDLINEHICKVDGILIQSEGVIKIVDCSIARLFGVLEKTKCIEIEFVNNVKTIFIFNSEEKLWLM